MKNLILTLSLFISFFASAKTTDFNFEASQLNAEFTNLAKLEKAVEANPTMTAEQLLVANPEIETSNLDITSTLDVASKDLPLVSPFWWGCCLGIVGLLVVYIITDNDRAQVKSAFWGCLISTLIFSIGGALDVFKWF